MELRPSEDKSHEISDSGVNPFLRDFNRAVKKLCSRAVPHKKDSGEYQTHAKRSKIVGKIASPLRRIQETNPSEFEVIKSGAAAKETYPIRPIHSEDKITAEHPQTKQVHGFLLP
jgi:hypothetical protein